MQDLISTAQVKINAPLSSVWDALTNPEIIKQYFFGTQVVTDWKVGSPIKWIGNWKGRTYEDKGEILRFEPEKVLETTYWSSMAGLPDKPENYKKVTYILATDGNETSITLTQDNNSSEEEKNHTQENWNMILQALKKLLEEK